MNSKYRMLWREMAGYRLIYGLALAALLVGSCFQYLVPLLTQVVIDGVLAPVGQEASPWIATFVARCGGAEAWRDALWVPALALVLLTLVAGAFIYLKGRWSALASERIARRVRDRLYDQLQHLPVRYHQQAETGDLVQRCTSDVETLRQFLAAQVVEIGRAVFLMLLPIPLMLSLDVRMTLVSLVFVPPIVLFSLLFFRQVQRRFLEVDEAEGAMTATLQENLTGIRVVRAFHRQAYEAEKFEEKNDRHRHLNRAMFGTMARFWSTSDFLCMVQLALVIGSGAYWMADGSLPPGKFYFFLAAVNLFLWPVRMLGRILTELGKATVAIGRIGEILDAEREAEPVRPARPATARGHVVFEDVVFAHEGVPVVQGVSFEARPGETIALLGPSGAGKSTLMQLLLRLHDPESGRILLDGIDIATLPRKEVRGRIAAVLQEPFLYSKSVRENIRLGRWNAADDEIEAAARAACVHESISEFDEGYDTLVGERGVTLSGGQRQRVALARALLDQPAVLVLDDALSAVDTETEAMILSALRARRGRETTLVIAHRLSTLMHADQILVLERGRIVEAGRHAELVARGGLYARLWAIQTSLEADLAEDLRELAGSPGR